MSECEIETLRIPGLNFLSGAWEITAQKLVGEAVVPAAGDGQSRPVVEARLAS